MSVFDGTAEELLRSLERISTDDLLVLFSAVLNQRATRILGVSGKVESFEGFVIAEIGYTAPSDTIVELISFDENRTRRAGFFEQGRCATCGCLVCSEVKLPNCPICSTPVECT